MPARRGPIDEAARRARDQVNRILADVRLSRTASGTSQRTVSMALACSRQEVGALESGRLDDVGVIQLARLAAALGLDLSVRAYPGGSAVRDGGQLRLLDRLRSEIAAAGWTWRTEVPVSADAHDRRAMDAVLVHQPHRVGVEALTRLVDAQHQCRQILLKQEAMGLRSVILLLADTRHNRAAVIDGLPTLRPAFPLGPRGVLRALRQGTAPGHNGFVLL